MNLNVFFPENLMIQNLTKPKRKIGSIIFGVGDSHTSFIWNKK